MTDRKKFHRWVRWHRKNFPPEIRVIVRLVSRQKTGGNHGLAVLLECGQVNIYISDSLNENETIETLWEEWAHALRFHHPRIGNSEEHDDVYGAWFNRIKRTWLGEV